ncbi:protein FAM171B-like [Hyperolius riggenbachi]|uniref:protein FAM171B-like n=1 Tax=Hyperolius riggenbachi TaxID=752182 RepID=UPI0035A297C1
MDPGHHTAFLLAILICILLLLLVASAVLMCYWKKNGFKTKTQTSSMRLKRLVRNQATSMTSFICNSTDLKGNLYNDSKNSQALSLPIAGDENHQKSKFLNSNLYLDSHIVAISDDEEEPQTSGLVNGSIQNKGEASVRHSALQCMLSSGASFFGSILEKSLMFSVKSKRRSSSLKSGVNADILAVPLESPVHVSSVNTGHLQSASLPRKFSRSSTLLCENSSDQQFTWDTTGLSGLSILGKRVGQKDSSSLPGTLERKPFISEEESNKQNVQLRKQDLLRPKAWFIFIGNRPFSDGAQLEREELNNVTSLDSGVDVVEEPVRNGDSDLKVIQRPTSTYETQSHIPDRRANTTSHDSDGEKGLQKMESGEQECKELHISHQEAARILNPRHYSRSLWEKREERPLIGAN